MGEAVGFGAVNGWGAGDVPGLAASVASPMGRRDGEGPDSAKDIGCSILSPESGLD